MVFSLIGKVEFRQLRRKKGSRETIRDDDKGDKSEDYVNMYETSQ